MHNHTSFPSFLRFVYFVKVKARNTPKASRNHRIYCLNCETAKQNEKLNMSKRYTSDSACILHISLVIENINNNRHAQTRRKYCCANYLWNRHDKCLLWEIKYQQTPKTETL